MKIETQNWLQLAESDYEAGLWLFQGAHHPQAVYSLCQAIEKLLKAVQIERLGQYPDKTHDLTKLTWESGLSFSGAQRKVLRTLSSHYNRVRYRDMRQAHYNTKAKVQQIIDQAQQIYLWIHKELTDH